MIVKINDLQYHVEVHGEGKPLVLLHGFTGDVSTWYPFISKWEKENQIILIDIIGHGKTDSPSIVSEYSMFEVICHLKDIFDQLQLGKVQLLGYSMGGRLALAYYFQFPSTVEKLILESSSPGLRTERERKERRIQDEKLGNYILEHGIQKFVEKWENIPLFESQKRLEKSKFLQIRKQRLQNNTFGLVNSLKGMGTGAQASYWSQLTNINCDTLLVTGELDTKFCNIAKEMVSLNPSLCNFIVKEAGHAIHVENPEFFGTIVSEFLLNDKK